MAPWRSWSVAYMGTVNGYSRLLLSKQSGVRQGKLRTIELNGCPQFLFAVYGRNCSNDAQIFTADILRDEIC